MTCFGFLYLQKGWPKKKVGLGPSVLSSLLVKSCREFFLVLVAFGLFDLLFDVVCKIFLSPARATASEGMPALGCHTSNSARSVFSLWVFPIKVLKGLSFTELSKFTERLHL